MTYCSHWYKFWNFTNSYLWNICCSLLNLDAALNVYGPCTRWVKLLDLRQCHEMSRGQAAWFCKSFYIRTDICIFRRLCVFQDSTEPSWALSQSWASDDLNWLLSGTGRVNHDYQKGGLTTGQRWDNCFFYEIASHHGIFTYLRKFSKFCMLVIK